MLSDNLQKERRILRTKASYKLGRYGSENAVPDGTASMPTKYSPNDKEESRVLKMRQKLQRPVG